MTVTHADAPPVVARRAWLGAGLALAAVGWGANQFAPLIVMYQARLGLSAAVADAMFGLYALGLVPALLAGGRLSDRAGRRAVVMPALVVSFFATCLLMAGGHQPLLLYAGRFLAGVASGLAFGTGAAWVKELSADAGDSAAGPRRATVAMTAGFAAGPLMASACAQWLPAPTVTAYLPHLAVTFAAAVPAWRTPDPGPAATAAAQVAESGPPRGLARHFLLVMAPFAPWVFGTAAIALAYLPALAAPRAGGHALLFSALVTGVCALAGIAAQPLARTALRLRPGRLLPASMALVLAGIACAAWAAAAPSLPLVVVASAVLGTGYGITQFAGLAEVQRIADPRSLGTATAAYQILSYLGFAFPFLMSLAASRWHMSPSALLLMLLGIAAAAAAWLAITTAGRRRAPSRPALAWSPYPAGTYAEYVAVPAYQLVPMPGSVSFAEAACLPMAALTAWQMLGAAGVRAGRHVLVSGASGGVGHLAVQLAVARGAAVTALARPGHHAALRELGAGACVDYADPDAVTAIGKVDAALDLVGFDFGASLFDRVKPGGVIALAAAWSVRGYRAAAAERGIRAASCLVEPDPVALAAIAGLVDSGAVRVVVGAEFGLSRAADAQRWVRGRRGFGKAAIVVSTPGPA